MKYGIKLIDGDINAFIDIEQTSKDTSRSRELALIETEAFREWENKNYSIVANIYLAIKDELNPIQTRRLNYSLKHLKD